MNSKSRLPLWLAFLTAVVTVGPLIVGGCALDKKESRPAGVFTRIGGHGGQLVEPKRCLLKIAIVARPSGDPTINDVVWRVADEQIIHPAERLAWEVNGLRVGRIIGEVPLELEAILKDTTPQKKVIPTNFFVVSGEPTLIVVSPTVEQASLLLNRDNRVFGNDYRDASGYFRVTPEQEGTDNVSLRLVPEIHHGPIQRSFQALATAAPSGPQEFMMKNGQQEDTIRELATTLVLGPGQIAIIGARPEYKRSLGNFMLSESIPHSDHRIDKLVMIWASRNLQGQGDNDENANAQDRPTLLKRLIGPAPTPTVAKPVPPTPEIPVLDTSVPTPSASTASAATGATANGATGGNGASGGSGAPGKANTTNVPAKTQTTTKSDQAP